MQRQTLIISNLTWLELCFRPLKLGDVLDIVLCVYVAATKEIFFFLRIQSRFQNLTYSFTLKWYFQHFSLWFWSSQKNWSNPRISITWENLTIQNYFNFALGGNKLLWSFERNISKWTMLYFIFSNYYHFIYVCMCMNIRKKWYFEM